MARDPPPLVLPPPSARTHNPDFVDDSLWLNRKRLFAKVITESNSLVSINWKDDSQTLNCPCFIGIVWWNGPAGAERHQENCFYITSGIKEHFAVDTPHQKQAVSCCFHTLSALSLTARETCWAGRAEINRVWHSLDATCQVEIFLGSIVSPFYCLPRRCTQNEASIHNTTRNFKIANSNGHSHYRAMKQNGRR